MAVEGSALDRLLAIMVRLRHPEQGCEWDRVQSFTTIAPFTIEEAYEVADAIARDDMAGLREELGDLLLQVVFHARIAEEARLFTFQDVAAGIADKLERRHPHLFAGGPRQDWETLKAAERATKDEDSALAGVAQTLPALSRAEKLQQRAARVGFDWPDVEGPAAKLREEMDELAAAADPAETLDEAGDLLFAAVNLVRAHGIAPEQALRAANAKFERRFRAMEHLAMIGELEFGALSLEDQEALWAMVKQAEQA